MNQSNRIEILNNIYNKFLGRDVDPVGIEAYYKWTDTEANIQLIKEHIQHSQEYKNKQNEKKKIVIPLNIYQTWHTKDLPTKMKENVELLKRQNPEFNYYLFDDDDCKNFIQQNFDNEVLVAFNTLIPGAYKADLWRYCVLYVNGGIYLDIKYYCVNNFKLMELTDKEYFPTDLSIDGYTSHNIPIYNGFMVSLKHNNKLLTAINKVVKNVKNKYYGFSPIDITGPVMFGEFFDNNEKEQSIIKRYVGEYGNGISLNNILILNEYKDYRNEQNKNQIHYHKLWENNNVYKTLYNTNSIIPLNLYTCWHTKNLPPKMKENHEEMIKNNPEFNFYLYDENECRYFIEKNFDEKVLYAYDNLIPCSYKSDLWRFCVLYINGGIYLDIKYKCTKRFKLISLTEKEHFVRDRPNNCIYTALIVTLPKNKIMLNCINNIVENVENKFYGECALSPTGPRLLGKNFTDEYRNYLEMYFFITNNENKFEKDYECIFYNNKIILRNYSEYREEQKRIQKLEHYSTLWEKKNIYK